MNTCDTVVVPLCRTAVASRRKYASLGKDPSWRRTARNRRQQMDERVPTTEAVRPATPRWTVRRTNGENGDNNKTRWIENGVNGWNSEWHFTGNVNNVSPVDNAIAFVIRYLNAWRHRRAGTIDKTIRYIENIDTLIFWFFSNVQHRKTDFVLKQHNTSRRRRWWNRTNTRQLVRDDVYVICSEK